MKRKCAVEFQGIEPNNCGACVSATRIFFHHLWQKVLTMNAPGGKFHKHNVEPIFPEVQSLEHFKCVESFFMDDSPKHSSYAR